MVAAAGVIEFAIIIAIEFAIIIAIIPSSNPARAGFHFFKGRRRQCHQICHHRSHRIMRTSPEPSSLPFLQRPPPVGHCHGIGPSTPRIISSLLLSLGGIRHHTIICHDASDSICSLLETALGSPLSAPTCSIIGRSAFTPPNNK